MVNDIQVFDICRKERIGVDRFSLKQAVILICATNRPDELDLEFVRPGRIDRRIYIGLPGAKRRVQIFGVHSRGKQLAEDVDFEQVSGYALILLCPFGVLSGQFFIVVISILFRPRSHVPIM